MDAVVKTGELTLRTAKLTKSILKQMREMTYQQFKQVVNVMNDARTSGEQPIMEFIGWVDGSVLDQKSGSYHKTWLIARIGVGDYQKFDSHSGSRNKFPQIFVV